MNHVAAPGEGVGGHWITSSARASTDGGIVRLRAFAVLRFMTSSNVVGCSTPARAHSGGGRLSAVGRGRPRALL